MVRHVLIAGMLGLFLPGHAQRPADALKTCLADSTSGRDRKDLAKWTFLAMAAHPEMKPLTSGTAVTAMGDSSRTMAALVTRLLTESCLNEARAAMKSDNAQQSLTIAFEGLGQLAMQELVTEEAVQGSMMQFMNHVDQERVARLLSGK